MSRSMFPIWKPQFNADEEPQIDTAVRQAIGTGSACWELLEGAGAFQTNIALGVADGLSVFIHETIKQDWDAFEARIVERRDFWQSYLDSGVTSSERPLAFTRVETLNGVLRTLSEMRAKRVGS